MPESPSNVSAESAASPAEQEAAAGRAASSRPKSAQLTSLLSNDLLSRLERMRIQPRRRLTNRSHGEHLSGKGGTSIEFSDYRNYVSGDDVRYVDWNIFARLNRPYLKLYRHEEEMHVLIILDASSSMMFEDKLRYAQQLAAAFAVMGLFSVERVSVFACNQQDSRPAMLPPVRGRISLSRTFQFLERIEPGGDLSFEAGIEEVLKWHRGHGVAVLLSDFLTWGDIRRSFNLLYSAGLELMAVQILGPSEVDPELTGDLRLVDAETQQALDISSASELLHLYHEHRLALEGLLADETRKRNGRFLSVHTGIPFETIVLDMFQRRGWVR